MTATAELAKLNSCVNFYKTYLPCGVKKRVSDKELEDEKTYRSALLVFREIAYLFSILLQPTLFFGCTLNSFAAGFALGLINERIFPAKFGFNDALNQKLESRAALKNWARILLYSKDIAVYSVHSILTAIQSRDMARLNGLRVGLVYGYYAGSAMMNIHVKEGGHVDEFNRMYSRPDRTN